MPPPSPLAIVTSALTRLVKEEKSYHAELAQQKVHLKQIEPSDENAEYQTRQEERAIDETNVVIEDLKLKIRVAAEKVENALKGSGNDPAEIEKAKEALESGKAAIA